MLYIRFQTVETDNRQTKGIFFLKKVIRKFGPRNFVPSPPKLGAKSPPLMKNGEFLHSLIEK